MSDQPLQFSGVHSRKTYMWKPDDSLDDYVVKALPETTEPPAPVSLRFTGEVEVLKPLARWERPAKLVPATVNVSQNRLSWFHRSLLAGGGLAAAALVLASAIAIGISDTPSGTETGQIEFIEVPSEIAMNGDSGATPEELLSSDIFSMSGPDKLSGTTSVRKRNFRIKRILLARHVPAPRVRRAVKPVKREPGATLVSKFVPTTLVIFIEDGLIKSRVEPWTADRK